MKINIELQPLAAQEHVSFKLPPGKRQEGVHFFPQVHIKDLDVEVLSNLCHEHRETMFKLAGKEDRADLQQRSGT